MRRARIEAPRPRFALARGLGLALASLGVALSLAGCLDLKAYQRGETIPYAEASAAKEDLTGLLEAELAKGHADRAFYALELARTRRFAGDFITKRDEPRVPTPAVRRIGDRFYEGAVEEARASGKPVPSRAEWEATLFGADGGVVLASRAVPPVAERTRAVRDAASAAQKAESEEDERFWEELSLLENRMKAYEQKAKQSGTSYADLFRDRIVLCSTQDARLTLAPGEALVGYHVGAARADAIVVTGERVTHVPLAGDAASISKGVKALRDAITGQSSRWREASKALHALVMAPVEAALAKEDVKTDALLLVTPGPLANVPFAALASGDGPGTLLIERYRIAYEPSFSVYRAILTREPKAASAPRILAVGNTSLALAPKEARVMGRIFEGSTTWIGPRQASEARFYAEVPSHNVLHLATHGLLVPSMPRLSHVLLGPDGAEDGFLTGVEVSTRLDLSHLHVAVLSACQTALSAEGGGAADAEIGSLTASFLLAGAPSVIGSLWSVSDESTTKLMVRFYERFLELGTAEALRRAQLELLKDERTPAFRHPFHWAAFGVYGMDK